LKDGEAHKTKEKKLNVYNQFDSKRTERDNNQKPVRYKDKTYLSISDIARGENILERIVRRYINDQTKSDW